MGRGSGERRNLMREKKTQNEREKNRISWFQVMRCRQSQNISTCVQTQPRIHTMLGNCVFILFLSHNKVCYVLITVFTLFIYASSGKLYCSVTEIVIPLHTSVLTIHPNTEYAAYSFHCIHILPLIHTPYRTA